MIKHHSLKKIQKIKILAKEVFKRKVFWKNFKGPLFKDHKVLLKTKIKILECHSTYPLRKNLIPEISTVPQISVDALSEENPLFPKLLRFRCGCSTEL